MSETNESGEIEKKIPVSEEDVENVLNYGTNFGVDVSPELTAAMDKFKGEQTYENMIDFKLEICKWLIESGHESFADSLWDHPKEAANDIVFDLQFDKDVQTELGEDEKPESK